MFIHGTRIRSLKRHLSRIEEGEKVVVGLRVSQIESNVLESCGFLLPVRVGDSVLPSSEFGPVSRFNSEGKEEVHRDRPMETAHRQVWWTWEEWRGQYATEECSKIVDVPYSRYPRTFIDPPSEEFLVCRNQNEELVLTTSPIQHIPDNAESVLHQINLFLEVFGVCEILTSDLDAFIRAPIRRMNWKVLPLGKRTWDEVIADTQEVVGRLSPTQKKVIEYRLDTVNSYSPQFLALGRSGFCGYIVFGFPDRNLYVLESLFIGNATFIFEDDWETLSQMTKAEILDGKRQKGRVIHRKHWEANLDDFLK